MIRTYYKIQNTHKLLIQSKISIVIALLIVANMGCGPIITSKIIVYGDRLENGWRRYGQSYSYDCQDFKVNIDLPKIHGSGVWFAFCFLPISQGEGNSKRFEVFLQVADNKTHSIIMNPFKPEKETVKILANNQEYLCNAYREIETSDYMGEVKPRHYYSFYVYEFDISELNTNSIGIVFSKNFNVTNSEHNNIFSCSIPNLNIQIEERTSFGIAIPGHANEIFSIKK